MSIISSMCWIPAGGAKSKPIKFQLTQEEVGYLQEKLEDVGIEDLDELTSAKRVAERLNAEKLAAAKPDDALDMDTYDDDDDFEAAVRQAVEESKDIGVDGMSDSEASDAEDYMLDKTDSIVIIGSSDEEQSQVEVHVYNAEEGALYVHHDFTIPSFPLALEWMDCAPGQPAADSAPVVGSYVAVGTFEPAIEIWNLDVLDVLEPVAVLGGLEPEAPAAASGGGKKRRSKKPVPRAFRPGSHTDAVMSLSWNRQHRQMLASGSADRTLKIWDVTSGEVLHSFDHHKGKVQCVAWNPFEPTILASASFDKTLAVVDARDPSKVAKLALPAEVESLSWDPTNAMNIASSHEDGSVVYYDVRAGAKPLWTLQAHSKAVSSVAFTPSVGGLMLTSSMDKSVKLWDIASGSPACIATKVMSIGQIFCAQFYPHNPWLLSAGGSEGNVAMWDLESDQPDLVKQLHGRVNFDATHPLLSVRPREDNEEESYDEDADGGAADVSGAAEAAL